MRRILATTGIVGTLAVGGLVGQASQFDAKVIPDRDIPIKGEMVKQRQVADEVQVELPWKGEQGIKLKHNMGKASMPEQLRGKRDMEILTETLEDGIKVDFILNRKPDTNVFCQAIEGAENYDFFYQPPLTQEEIDEGAERPENVVGSYAVYHKTLKNHIIGGENYETGKAFHIYRPEVWEINEKEATRQWAELSYADGSLCVTVDQDFLDNANYPVRVDPTFGYTSVGSDCGNVSWRIARLDGSTQSQRAGRAVSFPESGTLTSLHAAIVSEAVGGETLDVSVAINDEDSEGSGSHGEIANVENSNMSITTTGTFYTFTASGESLSADTYVYNAIANREESTDDVFVCSDVSSSVNSYFEANGTVGGYDSLKAENPWTDTASTDTDLPSIYATFTATAGEAEATTTPITTISGDLQISGDIVIE